MNLPSPKLPSNALRGALLASALLLGSLSAPLAETPEAKGLAIAEEMDRRDLGWGDSEATLQMILSNKQGETSVRDLRIQFLEVPEREEGDKSLTVFDHPRDIEGTAFLSHTKILDADDQWLYLPALKRVKRISSANKSGPFVGSEFAYEDLVSFEVDKYTYKWLRDETCGALSCFVVERVPLYESSGYTRQVVWVDQEEYRVLKVDFYDRRDSLLKTMVQSEFQEYLGQYWRPDVTQMENHQTGKATRLTYANWNFRVGVSPNIFTASRLKRAR